VLAAALPGSFFVSTGGRGNAGGEGASGAGIRLNGFSSRHFSALAASVARVLLVPVSVVPGLVVSAPRPAGSSRRTVAAVRAAW
jgi:hypothetical protein